MLTIEKTGPEIGVVISALQKNLSAAMLKKTILAGQMVAGEISAECYRTFKGSTGTLARSFNPSKVEIKDGTWIVHVGSDLVYARIHNDGGTIYPKTQKNLAIPLSDAKIPIGKWPRHWGFGKGVLKLVVLKGKKFLAVEVGRGKSKKLKLKYILKPQVTLRPTGYVERAANAATPIVLGVFEKSVDDVAKTLGSGKGKKQ